MGNIYKSYKIAHPAGVDIYISGSNVFSITESNITFSGSLNISGSLSINGTDNTYASKFIIHNGEGSSTPITTGIKYTTAVIADKDSTITGWKLFCNPSSIITLDVIKTNKAMPSSGNSITGSASISISDMQYSESTTLTNWNTSILAGDILLLKVVSNTASTYIQLELTQQ